MPSRRRAVPPSSDGGTFELFAEIGAPLPTELVRDVAPAAEAPSVREPSPRIESLEEVGDGFPGASPDSAIPIALLTATAKEVVEGAFVPLWVRGEVTGFKAHRNGHWYFSLRDAAAQIRCVVWSRDRRGIPAPPDEGMQVTAFGQLSVYAARGEMQFTIRKLEAEGDGLWRKALELTRQALERDGLLAPERKRALPRHPRTIAVVTSPDGAALHDIVAVLRRRAPGVRVVVVPAAVQGDAAPDELCAAIERVGRWADCDTVIVGRGGGAREDLWAFNDERVARALAACPVPTISAVGHEIDVTICDLVADWRAPTPSAAAEAVSAAAAETTAHVRALAQRMSAGIASAIGSRSVAVERARREIRLHSRHAVERRRAALTTSAAKLQGLSPVATLARGYAVARGSDGRTLGSTGDFSPDQSFELLVRDGVVKARAEDVKPGPWEEENA